MPDARRAGAPQEAAIGAAVSVAVPPLIWFGMLFLLRRMGGGRYHPPLDNEIAPGLYDRPAVIPGRVPERIF